MAPALEARVISERMLLLFVSVGLLLVGLISAVAFIAACAFVGLVAAVSGWLNHRVRRIAEGRRGEDICTFARAFDRRTVDPWIIRAVYEGVQAELRGSAERFPLRATDRLAEDFGIVDEDLDDLARMAAGRAGRTLDRATHDPTRPVRTVADLVYFLNRQPPHPVH